jgi:lipopolysaccharide transport system ATP-binding protein
MSSGILLSPHASPNQQSATLASDVAISVHGLGKCYRIYDCPKDRLKQALFRGRRQYFREFWALRHVSLAIRRGETVGIMGRNGCGKSTLLQLVCGTLAPTVGQIQIDGRIAALLELGAGFNREFTGRDNVYTNAAILGLSHDEIDARYQDIVAFAELGDFIDRPVKTYSSGMYVRLAFAVAISIEPDILVVDEALAVGDEAFQRKCYSRIRAIQERGGTILLVSHASGVIVELCNRAVLLDRGELLLSGRPKTVVNKYHKLLYTPPDQLASLREEIRHFREAADGSYPEAETLSARPKDGSSSARFDTEMKSRSAVLYTSRGAEIIDPRITTVAGQQVNILVPHEEYEVRYRVRFTKSAFRVIWGTTIKSMLGADLSGMTVPRVPEDYLPAGTEVEVAFRFRCELMSGVYFANVGVHGIVDGHEGFLHRMADALMFRVLEGSNVSTVGIVDLFVDGQHIVDASRAEGGPCQVEKKRSA